MDLDEPTDTIAGRFTIHVNGKTLSNDLEDNETITPAKFGSDPAIFTLRDGALECGDRFLGRHCAEDRSLLPKHVYWFKKSEVDRQSMRPTMAYPVEGTIELRFDGLTASELDGYIVVHLIQENEKSTIKMYNE